MIANLNWNNTILYKLLFILTFLLIIISVLYRYISMHVHMQQRNELHSCLVKMWKTTLLYCYAGRRSSDFITKTRLYNFDPLKPHFYTVKLRFTGAYIIFLISDQNIDGGYSLEPPRRGGSNEYPQSMYWADNSDNFFHVSSRNRVLAMSNIISDFFHLFGGKIFSIFE